VSWLPALFLTVLCALPLIYLRAWVVLTLAAWFLVPAFPGLRLPTEWQTAGILLLIGLVTSHYRDDHEDDSPGLLLVKGVARSAITSLATLGIGALVRWVGAL
jgi:hypothetical protein